MASLAIRAVAMLPVVLTGSACRERADTRLQPDEVLQAELGLTLDDRVHRVRITGGGVERADPPETTLTPGAYVEFMTGDWLIHEVVFEEDSLSAEQRAFLARTDQLASPPLIERDGRYVLSFEGAPLGRYVYRLEGNGRAGRGVIVVAAPGPA